PWSWPGPSQPLGRWSSECRATALRPVPGPSLRPEQASPTSPLSCQGPQIYLRFLRPAGPAPLRTGPGRPIEPPLQSGSPLSSRVSFLPHSRLVCGLRLLARLRHWLFWSLGEEPNHRKRCGHVCIRNQMGLFRGVLTDALDFQVAHVDDAGEPPQFSEEVQNRIIGPVRFHFEGHLVVIIAGNKGLGRPPPHHYSRACCRALQHQNELIHFLIL